MSSDRVEKLQQGLKALERQTLSRKVALQARLAQKKSLSPEDEAWLDNEANLVDERFAIDILEKASDYDAALEQLSPQHKEAISRVLKLVEAPSRGKQQRKRTL